MSLRFIFLPKGMKIKKVKNLVANLHDEKEYANTSEI